MFNLLAQITLISFYISQITLLNVDPNLSYNFPFMISNCFPRFQLQVVPHSVDSSTFISHCQRFISPDHIENPLTFGLMRSIQIRCSSLNQFQGLERRLDQGFQYCTTDTLGRFFFPPWGEDCPLHSRCVVTSLTSTHQIPIVTHSTPSLLTKMSPGIAECFLKWKNAPSREPIDYRLTELGLNPKPGVEQDLFILYN